MNTILMNNNLDHIVINTFYQDFQYQSEFVFQRLHQQIHFSKHANALVNATQTFSDSHTTHTRKQMTDYLKI